MTEANELAGRAAHARLDGDRSITIERVFAASPAKVFEAWTNPDLVAAWWDPTGAPLAQVDMDLREGGAFRFVHGDASGNFVFAGTYRRIDPPELLVFATPAPGGGETVGTLRFVAEPDGTRLKMTMEAPTSNARDELLKHGVGDGTARTLDNLARFLA